MRDPRTIHRPELVHPSVFIAPGAWVIGDVTIEEQASVWFGAVLRGDCERIYVGRRTNIQDLCVVHADPEYPCMLGQGVTVGHAAVVHGASVGDNVVIGMRAVVLNGAKVGAGSIVAAGAVVTEKMEIPPGWLVAGIPARLKRALTPEEIERLRHAADHYVENAARFGAPADTTGPKSAS